MFSIVMSTECVVGDRQLWRIDVFCLESVSLDNTVNLHNGAIAAYKRGILLCMTAERIIIIARD